MKERIKTLMESQHMTQQVFADFLGINPATLSGIFNDRTKPTINIVEAVKKKFPDISLDWLMFGTGAMFGKSASASAAAASYQAAAPDVTPTPVEERQLSQPRVQDQMLDFGDTVYTPQPRVSPAPQTRANSPRSIHPEVYREEVKIIDKPIRRVTEIRVYYDDQTWESFVPAKK